MAPAGMASMAARVDFGEDQLSGVARSSRAGMKRRVKAGPTSRGWSGRMGRVPRIHTLRRPFLSRIVVMVAVVTPRKVSMALASKGMGSPGQRGCNPFAATLPHRAALPQAGRGATLTDGKR